ncbi:hypothetical protein DM860_014813 [Cuscuta australis]|uniref:Uncharacterized protein n=1 Tax=Cuscuta australis TaxID=267555 RepID=A0A328CZS4_9ASTE|nr:hypothetical protein DM860_014813 [Cuscuta australis]
MNSDEEFFKMLDEEPIVSISEIPILKSTEKGETTQLNKKKSKKVASNPVDSQKIMLKLRMNFVMILLVPRKGFVKAYAEREEPLEPFIQLNNRNFEGKHLNDLADW